jgi:hypothetical protein
MLWLWWTTLALAGNPAVEGRDAMHQGNVRAARSALADLDSELGNARQLVTNAEVSGRYQLAVAIADLRARDGDMRAAMRQIWVVAPEGVTDPSLLTRSSLVTALAAERAAVVARPEVNLPHLKLPDGVVYIDGLELGAMPIYEGRHLVQVQCVDDTWSSAWSWMDRPEDWGVACPNGALAVAGVAVVPAAATAAPAASAVPAASAASAASAVPDASAVPAASAAAAAPAPAGDALPPLLEVALPPGSEAGSGVIVPPEADAGEGVVDDAPVEAVAPPPVEPAMEAAPAETPASAPAPSPETTEPPAEEQGFIATWTDRLWPLPFLDPEREKRFDPPGRALLVGPTLGFASGIELQFVPKGDDGGFFATAAVGYVPVRLSVSELGVGWQPRNSPHIGVELRGGVGLWHDEIFYTDGLLYLSGAVGARYDPPGPGFTAFLGGGRAANYVEGWWIPRANVGWQF